MLKPQGFVCGPVLYEYDTWFFQVSAYNGPWPLTKDGEPRKSAGKVFYTMYEKFSKLPPKERKKYRVGGGCVAL